MVDISKWPEWVDPILEQLGFSYAKPSALAASILELSTHYQAQTSVTPWDEKRYQAAYFAYFFPLNLLRLEETMRIAMSCGLLEDEEQLYDFGAGPAVAAFALPDHLLVDYYAIETSEMAKELFRAMGKRPETRVRFVEQSSLLNPVSEEKARLSRTALFSYSLNEYRELPDEVENFDSLIIVEPSTQQAGRELLDLRKKLINSGYSILAPCLHHQDCPLMVHSKKDWCHHRIAVKEAEWLKELEKHLPIKNETITFSYLIASRQKPATFSENTFRITGDLRKEKGKTKVLACRGDQREFLSWLKKEGHSPELSRGDIVELSADIDCDQIKKGDELRPGENYRKLTSIKFEN